MMYIKRTLADINYELDGSLSFFNLFCTLNEVLQWLWYRISKIDCETLNNK